MAVWLHNWLYASIAIYITNCQASYTEMSSDVFWKSPPWRHLNAVPQVNCSTRMVHWQQNSCHHRLSLCAEQTAGTRWLIIDVNGRSSTCSTQTDILEPVHDVLEISAVLMNIMKTRTDVLNLILCQTGSQWSSHITDVMWSIFLAPVNRRAAAFWSDGSLSSSRPVTPTKSCYSNLVDCWWRHGPAS